MFRRINRHGQIASIAALTSQAITLVLNTVVTVGKNADATASVAGHSLRAGYCTEAATAWVATHGTDQTRPRRVAAKSRPPCATALG